MEREEGCDDHVEADYYFFPSQIKSSRDVKGLFLGISIVSSQVSMQLVGELLRKEGSSVMAAS